MKKVSFMGWENCIEMTSGNFRIIITTGVGPRVIGGFIGNNPHNIFNVDPALAGTSGADKWVNYGGHRLWVAPERENRTQEKDNVPVKYEEKDGGIIFYMPEDERSGMEKSIFIKPVADGKFYVEHSVTNKNIWPVELAPWAISVMAPGGMCIAPQNKDKKALLPNTFYSFWPYTEVSEKRFVFGKDFLFVKQDVNCTGACKIGFNCKNNYIAYANAGTLFVKEFTYIPGAKYPDNGCTVEVYSCKSMLEVETLAPLRMVDTNECAKHIEIWSCRDGIGKIENCDDAAEYLPRPVIAE
ncbi:MAG: hypothetical protein IKA79_07275 [Lentisphaeria bacterium]|nr:hypothetical protein [Lentisphaeria bacterium]